MKLDCSQIYKLKEAYVDGRVEPEMREAIAAHAEICPD